MVLSLIGQHAGLVWEALEKGGKLDFAQLKKTTNLTDKQLGAAMGWLAREGKLVSEEVKKGRKMVEAFSLVKE